MEHVPIYTIGYGNRSMQEFIELLHKYRIAYLADIRSQPFSRYAPQFSKNELSRMLKFANIEYLFLGNALGGRPSSADCYVNGKVDYVRLCEQPFYLAGIARLKMAWKKQLHVALMCSELKPEECHRSKLIGNTLLALHISVAHIDEAGTLKSQEEINRILSGGNQIADQLSLFNESPMLLNGKISTSRKRYVVSE